jgi:hypothetical protein
VSPGFGVFGPICGPIGSSHMVVRTLTWDANLAGGNMDQ